MFCSIWQMLVLDLVCFHGTLTCSVYVACLQKKILCKIIFLDIDGNWSLKICPAWFPPLRWSDKLLIRNIRSGMILWCTVLLKIVSRLDFQAVTGQENNNTLEMHLIVLSNTDKNYPNKQSNWNISRQESTSMSPQSIWFAWTNMV